MNLGRLERLGGDGLFSLRAVRDYFSHSEWYKQIKPLVSQLNDATEPSCTVPLVIERPTVSQFIYISPSLSSQSDYSAVLSSVSPAVSVQRKSIKTKKKTVHYSVY